jgi:hypothetical protein
MKKKYEKPMITKVALRPEEAVLTACKTNSPCKTSWGDNSNCKTSAS